MNKSRSYLCFGLLVICALILAACAPSAPPSQAPPPTAPAVEAAKAADPYASSAAPAQRPAKPAWQIEWDKTVEAAKKESLIITSPAGDNDKNLVAAFKKAYPDIPVEHTGARPSDISPRIVTEQRNGVFAWDAMWANGASNMHEVLLAADAFQDIPPLLLLPEVLDDSKWGGGKAGFYSSSERPGVFIHEITRSNTLYVNREKISRDELGTLDQLIDPKFKGKIVVDDCTVAAGGTSTLVGVWQAKGEAFVRTLLTTQQPVFTDVKRINSEWVATGRYPIGVGSDEQELQKLQGEGIGKSVEKLEYDGGNVSGSGVGVFKNAPHPNAGKVFLNWFLSREGQMGWIEAWATPIPRNSRRLDTPVRNPEVFPDFSKLSQYAIWGTESGTQIVRSVISACKEARP